MQRERCELLSTLLMIYEAPGASAGALKCSGHRVLELVRMMGAAVFSTGSGSLPHGGQNAFPMAEMGSSAALAEQLVRFELWLRLSLDSQPPDSIFSRMVAVLPLVAIYSGPPRVCLPDILGTPRALGAHNAGRPFATWGQGASVI